MYIKNRTLIILIIVGTILRLIGGFLPGFKFDMDAWFFWALRLNELGFNNFYSPYVWTNYTPGYLYILAFLGFIKNIFTLNNELFYFVLKLPSIVAEIILGILIYNLAAKRLPIKLANLSGALIFLNPAIIFNSSVWGQIDGLLTLFMFLAIYFLVRNQLIPSSITFALAILIKPQALFLSPVYIFFILQNFNIKNILRLTIPGTLLALLVSLPFFINQPFNGLIQLIVKMSNDYPVTSLFAYNFWGVIGFWIPVSTIWNNLTYKQWGLILLSLYWIAVAFFYLKKSINLYSLAALACLSFYFLPTQVHERYLYSAIPFLILAAAKFRSNLLFYFAIILSLAHLLNLYYVYVYYNEIFSNSTHILYWRPLYNLLDQNTKTLSLFSTIIFLYISLLIVRLNYVRKDS